MMQKRYIKLMIVFLFSLIYLRQYSDILAQYQYKLNDSGQKQGTLTFPTLTPTPQPTATPTATPVPTQPPFIPPPTTPPHNNCGICAQDVNAGIQRISRCIFTPAAADCAGTDINGDGRVDAGDVARCGQCAPAPTEAPAPTATPASASCGAACSDSVPCTTGHLCVKDPAPGSIGICAIWNSTAILRCTRTPSVSNCCTAEYSEITPIVTNTPTPSVSHAPTRTSTPTRPPTSTPTKTPTPTPIPKICNPGIEDMTNIQTIGGMQIGYAARADNPRVFEWYYMYPESITYDQILQNVRILFGELSEQDDEVEFREKIDRLLKELKSNPGCPVRFTGASPTLFVYGAAGSHIKIAVNNNLVYADPALKSGIWNIELQEHTLLVNGLRRPYIYYEYEKRAFTRPKTGWIIRKQELRSLTQTIGESLSLYPPERERLLFELDHAATSVDSEHIFIGIIDPKEIEEKLPIYTYPMQKTVSRYHFYTGKAHNAVPEPYISPLIRPESFILELGAVGYNE